MLFFCCLCAAVQTAFGVGKIQVSLRKKKAETKWQNLGQPLELHNTFVPKKERGESESRGSTGAATPPSTDQQLNTRPLREGLTLSSSCVCFLVAPHYCECLLVSKTEVNHNTLIFRVKLPPGTIRHVPVGTHVYLKALVEGEQSGSGQSMDGGQVTTARWLSSSRPPPDAELVRPYTPVDQSLTASSQETDLFLMVKVYPDGVFSSYLSALHIGRSSQQNCGGHVCSPMRGDESPAGQGPADTLTKTRRR